MRSVSINEETALRQIHIHHFCFEQCWRLGDLANRDGEGLLARNASGMGFSVVYVPFLLLLSMWMLGWELLGGADSIGNLLWIVIFFF